jgi:toxin FitB
MILLDTNVLSDAMLPKPDPAVIAWLDRQPRLSVWTSSVTVLELRFGIALLPRGRQRTRLEQALERTLSEMIEDRILALDTVAAEETAVLMADRQRRGRPVELRDAMIAGIAIARKATLATRNTRHFADLPITVVDPWTS